MDPTVKLSSKEVPYLTPENVNLHSKLVFYDENHTEVRMNLTILRALNCNFLQYLDYEESEIAVSTDFHATELQELQRFYLTGQCNLQIVSSLLDALGIDLTQFCLRSKIKVEVKEVKTEPNDTKDDLMYSNLVGHDISDESEYSEYIRVE